MNDECSPSNDPDVLAKTNAPNGTFNPEDSIRPTTISGNSRMLKAMQTAVINTGEWDLPYILLTEWIPVAM